MPCDVVSFIPELSAMHNTREEDPDEQDKSKPQQMWGYLHLTRALAGVISINSPNWGGGVVKVGA